mgnify:CR=1 FL=1
MKSDHASFVHQGNVNTVDFSPHKSLSLKQFLRSGSVWTNSSGVLCNHYLFFPSTEHYPDSGNKVAEGLKKFFVSLIYDKKCREIMNAILDPKCTCEAAAEKSVSLSLFYSIPVKLVSTKYRYPKKWCKSGLAQWR